MEPKVFMSREYDFPKLDPMISANVDRGNLCSTCKYYSPLSGLSIDVGVCVCKHSVKWGLVVAHLCTCCEHVPGIDTHPIS